MLAQLRARLAEEKGMTLVELLTTMAILGLVLTAILGMFVSGLRAEVDMNQRFQAQQEARLALSGLRTDVRTACTGKVSTDPGNLVPSDTVQLGVCSNSSTTWSPTALSYVTWCVRNEGGSPTHYGLYRESAATGDPSCATGTAGIREADWLTGTVTTKPVFTCVTPSGSRPEVQVSVPVDANPSTSGVGVYTLSDTIMLRNAAAGAACT